MTEYEKKECFSVSLDSLTLALESLSEVDEKNEEIEHVKILIENAYNKLLQIYEDRT